LVKVKSQPIVGEYAAKFPRSKALYEKAKGIFPRGVPHDAWFSLPFPIHIAKAKGSHEWDADGYEYIDYFGGHGGLILGHAHPSVVKAVSGQVRKGTQYGACNELAIEWAELIMSLIPSAQRVEFTCSGTEANMLAIRLARAFTGRRKVVKFRGHFGGWADDLYIGLKEPWNIPASSGLLPTVLENTVVIQCNNEEILEDALRARDVSILVVEAAGASSGAIGIAPSFYQVMRDLTSTYGTLLHFDEVVTGFRFSPGGVQAVRGIIPDLTSLGKCITGVIPGAGAVVGRADVMEMLLFKDDQWNRYNRITHEGTFNANPLCAASGIATLKMLATGRPQMKADRMAEALREGIQHSIEEKGVLGCVYGDFSVFHIYFGNCEMRDKCDRKICLNENKGKFVEIGKLLALNLAVNGVHMPAYGVKGFTSAVHTQEDVYKTIKAFDASLNNMIRENILRIKNWDSP
jgi:glutamate-1-semialdehyde 2,1-aminomutase